MAGLLPLRGIWRVALAALLLGGALSVYSQSWDFSRILQRAEQLYGPLGAGRERIGGWQRMLADSSAMNERQKLDKVNAFFNAQLRFEDDRRIWRQEDYWATPVESLMKGAGDCEDYALAKYFSLRQLGVPSSRLRITYVKALRLNQAHMVLTYYETPNSVPLVLDNLISEIRPASQRQDLLPVYAFNGEGLWLSGKGNQPVGDSKRLSRWQDVLKKMAAEGFPANAAR